MSELDDILSSKDWGAPSAPAAPAAPSPLDEVLSHKGWGDTDQAKAAAAAKVTADTPWSEVLTRGAHNLPGDVPQTIGEIAGGLGHAVMNPTETAQGIGNLAKGTWDYMQGNESPASNMAQKVGNELYNAYGTEQGWKEGIANRPFSRALDVGTLMTAPEALAGKAGMTGLAKGIRYANPATWAIGGVQAGLTGAEKLASEGVGHMFTHTGGEPLKLARQAGREGPEAMEEVRAGMRNENLPEAVEGFKTAMEDVKHQGQQEWRGLMSGVSKTEALNSGVVWDALDEIDQRFGTKTRIHPSTPSAVEQKTAETRQALNGVVQEHMNQMYQHGPVWGSPNGNTWLSPIGLDDLKRKVSTILETTKPGTESYAAGSVLRDAINKEIKANSPLYAKAMSKYHAMHEALDAYNRELSLGSTPDTALRKLLSGLRNNVVANFGRRRQLIEELAKHPEAKKALYRLAGSALSSWSPRGLIGQLKLSLAPLTPFAEIAAVGHGVNPFLIPASMAMQSPKLMGKFALRSGQAARTLSKVPWRTISPFLTQPGNQSMFSMMDTSPFLGAMQNAQGGTQ